MPSVCVCRHAYVCAGVYVCENEWVPPGAPANESRVTSLFSDHNTPLIANSSFKLNLEPFRMITRLCVCVEISHLLSCCFISLLLSFSLYSYFTK